MVIRGQARRHARISAVVALAAAACTVPHDMRPVSPADENRQMQVEANGATEAYPCEARRAGAGEGVRWFGPAREPDRRELATWCSAVGPVELVARPSRSFPPPDSVAELTIATWNVHVGGGDLPGFLESELGYDCDVSDGARFQTHFVLLAQEAYRASDRVPEPPEGARVAGRIAENPPAGSRMDMVQMAQRCGLALFYVPLMRNGREAGEGGPEDRGSAILSTLPLSGPVAIELPLEAQRRVAVLATVPGPGGDSLRVASVHLDVAGNILRVLSTGGSMRVRQSDGLTEAIDMLDPNRAIPIVVAGDMNTWSASETVILRMLRTYPDSPSPGKEKTRGAWPPDHLFFRAGEGPFEIVEGSYRVVENAYGSDHNPRLAKFARR